MNGTDIFLALNHIGDDLVEEAEVGLVRPRRLRPMLAAALIAALLLAGLVGGAVAYGQGWFGGFFQETSGAPLTPGQTGYLQDQEQVIGQAQTHDGWTIQLRSALNDGTTAYILLGVTAPEGVSLEPQAEGDHTFSFLQTGNQPTTALITCTQGVNWDSLNLYWLEDGDGLPHTRNYIIQINPIRTGSSVDPFGPKASYHITIENIVRTSKNRIYEQSLLDTKYQEQEGIMFTPEETQQLWKTEVLAEGVWTFDVTLNGDTPKRELLSSPITTQASVYQKEKGGLYEMVDVTLTSAILRPLSITLYCSSSANYPNFATGYNQVFAVRKDGSSIQLLPGGAQGRRYQELKAETPLIFDELDHILLADGTKIPVAG